MILTGQKYTNEPRVYWHGSVSGPELSGSAGSTLYVNVDLENEMCRCNPIILNKKYTKELFTNSKFRPLLHRLHPFNHHITDLPDTKNFGTLCMLTQRRPLNIFNVRTKKDSRVFKEMILERGLRHDEHAIRFGAVDFAWIVCHGNREELINAIKERGYDGFLNYTQCFNYDDNFGTVPMCLFDPLSVGDFIQKRGKEVMSFDAVKELHSFEMSKLMDDVFIAMKRGDDKVKIIDDMLSRINNFFRYKTILEEDIERTYEEVSSGKVPESARIKEAIENNGEYHYGWDGQLTGKLW